MPTLSQILSTQLIPWSEKDAAARFIVAQPDMCQADMPYGVELIRDTLRTKRVIVKGKRCYNNVRNIVAEWPEEGLQEISKYLLVCVLKGSIDYRVGDYRLRCGSGHFMFIPPGLPCPNGKRTYVDLEKSTFCTIMTFLLHPNALEFWTSHGTAEGRERSNNSLVMHERVVAVFQAMMDEVMSGQNQSARIGAGLLHSCLMLLEREVSEGHVQTYRSVFSAETQIRRSPSADFVGHLENYVQTNLRIPLTLETVSAEMYFSPAQFARVMRRETGQSFNEFLAERRLIEAKKLLESSQWGTSVVASFVGFKSHSYFCTFFKRHTGMTPAQYRLKKSK